MANTDSPDVIVFLCRNCIPEGGRLPRQWGHNDTRIAVLEVPCSGKIDAQYLLAALEGGRQGLCVVTCPKGQCRLAQGNYRAEIRIATVRRLLGEIGLEPERVELLRFGPEDSHEQFEQAVREAAARISALGPSPIRASQILSTSG
ncbi:MAG: hydrogenase iron-sulfur subunit [Thermoguttaceae bacterium]